MPRTFGELIFEPTIEELRESQSSSKVTIFTGGNNSGKSAYLKRLGEFDKVLYMGPNRFYSFHHMGLYNYDPNEINQIRQNLNNQRFSQYSNFEGMFYDTNRALSRLSNQRRQKLFDVFSELFLVPVTVEPEIPDNDLSQRYVNVDGDSLSVTSSGTRLFLGLLAAMMDERFEVVALG